MKSMKNMKNKSGIWYMMEGRVRIWEKRSFGMCGGWGGGGGVRPSVVYAGDIYVIA